MPKLVRITREDMACIDRLKIRRKHAKEPAFTAIADGRIWACPYRDYTGPLQPDLRGRCRKLDEIADELLSLRRVGGRFFITDKGAFYKDEKIIDGPKTWFVDFELQ